MLQLLNIHASFLFSDAQERFDVEGMGLGDKILHRCRYNDITWEVWGQILGERDLAIDIVMHGRDQLQNYEFRIERVSQSEVQEFVLMSVHNKKLAVGGLVR